MERIRGCLPNLIIKEVMLMNAKKESIFKEALRQLQEERRLLILSRDKVDEQIDAKDKDVQDIKRILVE